MVLLNTLDKIPFKKNRCYRLIPSKFPPVPLFEDVASEADFADLYAIQALTNPRIQDEMGNLSLVRPEERVYAIPGSGYVMAAFTHINPNGSRFSNGDYGVYYASETLDAAIAETVYHREQFLQFTKEPAQTIEMRTLSAEFSAELYNLLPFDRDHHALYSLTDYRLGQELGAEIKRQNEAGLMYYSVRVEKERTARNFALFKPNCIHQCKQTSHYIYQWDGSKISAVYKKTRVLALG
ncbi:MAG: RES family NAD+ phosphorylase [Tatlockia sp.]|jgi:hypothetical protein